MNKNAKPLLDRDQVIGAIHELGIEEDVLNHLILWIIQTNRIGECKNSELKSRLSVIRKLNDAKWKKEELEALTDLSQGAYSFIDKFGGAQ